MYSSLHKKKKPARRVLLVFSIIIIIVVGMSLWTLYSLYSPQDNSDQQLKEIVIKENQGVSEVAQVLTSEGVIHNSTLFQLAVYFSGKSSKIRSGNYELSPHESILDTIEIITGGETKQEGAVTVVEGLSNQEIAALFADYHSRYSTDALAFEEGRLAFEQAFLAEASQLEKYQAEYSFLIDVPEGATLEGYLFPDTYRIYKDAPPEDIIKKMLDNFDRKVSRELQVTVKSQGKTLFDVVTLASIIQNEISKEYMKDVSGVFHNRLKDGIKLKSDATVNYITKKGMTQPTFEDTEIDSPYSTYVYAGLPAGPISNPGLDAIEAAIYPTSHDYYYFLTPQGSSEPIFSKNGKEHLENKEMYLP
ncbi:endolytic transglycosylase MltG [Patescibacteria group bacterium]|nr:endolytic transglycosylase MltG [Patescibacteria group bacterium]